MIRKVYLDLHSGLYSEQANNDVSNPVRSSAGFSLKGNETVLNPDTMSSMVLSAEVYDIIDLSHDFILLTLGEQVQKQTPSRGL